MATHEACLGAARVDNFAVSSYVSVMALLVNRAEDVQELRRKGVVVSALSDEGTLRFVYRSLKTIVVMLSVVGVLGGPFKTILSLKQPQRK
ncbi:hypothetical protein BAE44_0026082 [Dichanthelium oligosanthes]|uniref:Uncharacterized protein n=1 Tax=Dichanthelium oligosanthes TaxID=888268 RepID=A0A1E5UJ48_9POAL|nr:hypothetical protein BAE44_0026082 [Dichanthelium oligosanthes]